MTTAFKNCDKPYASGNLSYLTSVLEHINLESHEDTIVPQHRSTNETSNVRSNIRSNVRVDVTSDVIIDSLWTKSVSADVVERFVTAVFLHNSRNGIILGDKPEDYPQYYQYDFDIAHPEQFHRKLISKGYLTYADTRTKLKFITVPEIKRILSNHSLPVSGNKEKLIQTALSNIDENQLKSELNNNKLTMLTENGESFLSFSEGYSELYRCGWQIYLFEYEDLRKKGVLNFTEAAEIILKERDKKPDFCTKLFLAQLYYKQKEFSLSLAYYIQTMYYEASTMYSHGADLTDDTFFAPENQERIAKLAEYFTEDMIERCYTDNPKVVSTISKWQFSKAVHDALNSKK